MLRSLHNSNRVYGATRRSAGLASRPRGLVARRPSGRSRGVLWLVVVLCVSLGASLGAGVAWAGSGSWEVLKKNPRYESVVVTTWDFFRFYGFSEAATAGIMGNIDAESTFNPGLENGSGCAGFVQFCGSRLSKFKETAHKDGVDWKKDHIWQLKYILTEMSDKDRSGNWWSKDNHNIKSYNSGSGQGIGYDNINGFKVEDDPVKAARVFLVGHEVPCAGAKCSGTVTEEARSKMAQEIFNGLKGRKIKVTENFKGAEGALVTAPGDSSVSATAGDASAATAAGVKQGEVIPEDQLKGLRKEYQIGEADVDVLDVSSLSVEEQARMGAAKGQEDSVSKKITGLFASAFAILGVLLMLWSVFLVAAGLMDRSNGFLPFSAVKLLSGRSLVGAGEKAVNGQITWPKLILVAATGMLVGIVLVTGMLFGIIYSIVSHIQSLM